VADPGTDEYWAIGIVVIAAFSLIGIYHGFGLVRQKKTRRAVIYSAFAISLMAGASIISGVYQAMTIAAAEPGPYLSWSEDPMTTMTISWESPVPSSKILEWSGSAAFSNPGQLTAGEHDYRSITGRIHYNVTITGLQPNTTYYYRVPGFHDQVTPFTTAPNTTIPFTFFAYGDTREAVVAGSEHLQLMNQMVALSTPGTMPAFILNSGDIANDWDDLSSWDAHFSIIKPLARSVPYFVELEITSGTGRFRPGQSTHADPRLPVDRCEPDQRDEFRISI